MNNRLELTTVVDKNRINPFAGMSRQDLMDYVAKHSNGQRTTAGELHKKFRALSEEARQKREAEGK